MHIFDSILGYRSPARLARNAYGSRLSFLGLAVFVGMLIFPLPARAAQKTCAFSLVEISDIQDAPSNTTGEEVEDVDMFSETRTEFPNACCTTGLGPCLGIAVINKRTRVVHLGHFVAVDEEFFGNQITNLVAKARSESESLSELQVVLTGMVVTGLHDTATGREYDLGGRARVDRALVASGISKKQILDKRSTQPEDASYELLVDTARRMIFIARVQRRFPNGT